MVNLAIDKFPPDALRRVLDAPVEMWTWQAWFKESGGGCLMKHAADLQRVPGYCDAVTEFMERLGYVNKFALSNQFDLLCARFGLSRIVRCVKLRALRALEAQTQEATATHPEPAQHLAEAV